MAEEDPKTLREFYDRLSQTFFERGNTAGGIGLIQAKNEHERNLLEQDRIKNDSNRMMFESVMGFSHLAIRSLLLLNGGAAIALLAFTGHLASNEAAGPKVIEALSGAILLFGSGAGCGTAVALLAYISQSLFHSASLSNGGRVEKWAIFFRLTCVVVALVGMSIFVVGLVMTTDWALATSQPASITDELFPDELSVSP